jgi:hypothetical protein
MSNDRMFQATRHQQARMEHVLLEDREQDYETKDALSQSETDEVVDSLKFLVSRFQIPEPDSSPESIPSLSHKLTFGLHLTTRSDQAPHY